MVWRAQEAINAAPEERRPKVLISTSAIGEPQILVLLMTGSLGYNRAWVPLVVRILFFSPAAYF